jgi:hypothetical protein
MITNANPNDIREAAFRNIQQDPEKYRRWNDALTQYDRDNMLIMEIVKLAYDEGYDQCGSDRDELQAEIDAGDDW